MNPTQWLIFLKSAGVWFGRRIVADETYYYRFESRSVSDWPDEFGNPTGSHVEAYLLKFVLIKKTSKGAWIGYGKNSLDKRFVRDVGIKRYAHTSIFGALESFRARKKRQIKLLNRQIKDAEEGLRKVSELAAGKVGLL